MLKRYPNAGSVEPVSDRRGIWNPELSPTVAAFAAMPKPEQDKVVVTCRRVGFRFAVEVIPVGRT